MRWPASTRERAERARTALAIVLRVHLEDVRQRLLEDALVEEVADHAEAARRLDARAHLQQPQLVQRAREHVDRLPVLAAALRQALVERLRSAEVRRLAALDVDVPSNRLLQRRLHDQPGARRARAADEDHDVGGRLRARDLQQRRRDRQRAARRALGAVLSGHRPLRGKVEVQKYRVFFERGENRVDGRGALADRHDEPRNGRHGTKLRRSDMATIT